MSKMKKALLVLLSMAMSATLFVACGKKGNPSGNENSSSSSTGAVDNSSSSEDSSSAVEHSHEYTELKYDAENHWYECACGEKSGQEEHKGGEAACTGAAVCVVCEQPYGSVGEHIYNVPNKDETYHWNECGCGEIDESSKVEHEYSEAKKDETNHWSECVCGVTSDVTAHEYNVANKDEENHWNECACGAIDESSKVAHDYAIENKDETNHWNECACGATSDVTAHEYNVANKDEENHWNECVCGAIDESSKVAHEYSEAKKDETNHWNECACGATDGVTAHEYNVANKDETSHWNECACGAIDESSKVAHEYSEAKKDETNHWNECSCGATSDVTAHSAAEDAEWKADAENHWKECVCGAEVEKDAHSGEYAYVDNGDTHTKSNACCGFEVETVEHTYNLWDTTSANYDYKACVCGAKDTTQAFDKSVSLINQEVLLTDSAPALNISGIDENASIVSIKFGDYDFGTNPAALVIPEAFKADTQNHGKQKIVITAKDAGEAEHAISVPVTFITKTIATAADFKSIQPTSAVKGVWGYYVLTADISDTSFASSSYVGDWEETTGFFATLDGAGHTISTAANGAGGLFGILRSATIKNLTVKDNWRSAWASGGASLLAKACFNSTLENVTFTYVAGNTSVALGNGHGWICISEFNGNLLKNVTVNDSQGYGSLFGYKFYNNVFDNVTINGTYTEMGHTAPVVDEEGNEVEAAKSVTYDEVAKAEAVEMEKVTLETRQDFVLEGAVSTLDLGDYNDATVVAIKTSTGYELYGLSSDVATSSFKAAKEFHGEQNIIVTVKTADGKLLEVIVPVTVITKAISTMADLQTAVKHMGVDLYGYYILANNVAYTEAGYVGKNASYAWNAGTGFKGTLDGRGYTITMAGNNSQHGLFGTLHGATVKNVHIINAWYNGWGAATLGYTAYNTTFDNVTITICGNTISDIGSSVGAVVGAETGGCTWKDVTINLDQAQGTLFKTINKDNKMDTFENVTVNGTITQFCDKGTPDGVTIAAPNA